VVLRGGTVIRAAPHVYDVVRWRIYGELSVTLTEVYASPRGDLFGVAWDVVIPCGAALLATLLFLQQRTGNSLLLPSQRRARSSYQMVSHT
jgi:ubiquitin-conjugating enzyme E2 O